MRALLVLVAAAVMLAGCGDDDGCAIGTHLAADGLLCEADRPIDLSVLID